MIELLDFETQWPRSCPAKEEAIRAVLGIPPARYYQRLGRIIDTVEALKARPQLVHRLRRMRDERVRRQAARVRRFA